MRKIWMSLSDYQRLTPEIVAHYRHRGLSIGIELNPSHRDYDCQRDYEEEAEAHHVSVDTLVRPGQYGRRK